VPAEVALKAPADWKLIGAEDFRRLDSGLKATGKQDYTIDVKLPGMLTAMVAHPPLFGATVKSFDPAAAKAVKGVVDVVQISRGVAVVAENTWAAMKGREALTVEWDESQAEKRGSAQLMQEYLAAAEQPPRWWRRPISSPTSPMRRWSRWTRSRTRMARCWKSGAAIRCPTSIRPSPPRSPESTRRR
jgi:CO/xanthine dehydrogenase Mo-binding subunit